MSRKCKVLQKGQCEINQGFGGINNHRGLDLVGANYTIDNVVSFDNGKVLMAVTGYSNGAGQDVNWRYGNFVKILHDNGQVTLYAHLESTNLKVGQRVSKGQLIGKMGNSGHSFGSHLHWELWSKDNYNSNINPEPYLEDKPSFIPPKVVERNTNKRQFQVDYNDNLRVRATPNGTILGILNKGIYDFVTEQKSNGINWVQIQNNMWCGCTDMSRILEIEKQQEKPLNNDLSNETLKGYIDTINELKEQIKVLDKEILIYKQKLLKYNNMQICNINKNGTFYILDLKEKDIIYLKRGG